MHVEITYTQPLTHMASELWKVAAWKFISELGYIPPVTQWPECSNLRFDSRSLHKVHKGQTVIEWLSSLDPELPQHYRVHKDSASDFEIRQSFEWLVSELGRTPSFSDWKRVMPSCPFPTILYQPRLFQRFKASTFGEVLQALGYEQPPQFGRNSILSEHLARILPEGWFYKEEPVLRIEGRIYKLDYLLKHPNHPDVYLEVDGSSHYTVNSVFHRNSFYWAKGVSSPEESFAKKQTRDRIINQFCATQRLRLLRIEHHAFLEATSLSLYLS